MGQATHYPNMNLDGAPLTVEHLLPSQAVALTPAILEVIVDAYGRQFEGPEKSLPTGAFANVYATAEKEEYFHDTYIPGVYRRGGGYYVVREPADAGKLIAVLKTLPGEAIEGRFSGRAALAEILTRSERQHHGLGSAVLHTYLNDLDPQTGLVLDAFDNSPVNHWYSTLGFSYEEPSGALEVDGYRLPTHYMVTDPQYVTADSMIRRMRLRNFPRLQDWIITSG